MIWTEEINTNFNFPHIDIINQYADGVLRKYEARTHDGYVMYDTTANDVELRPDEETGELIEIPVIYYCTLAGFPKTYNFANFPYVAVPRDSVDENYIFGVGDNNEHEIM